MDAPPEHEDCRPFVHVAGLLAEAGIHAPRILAQDLESGFLLLTDLGTRTYLDALDENNALRQALAQRQGKPPEFAAEFAKAPLPEMVDARVILKGDANYRRLLDDRHWPFTAPLEEAAGYFPTSFDALRTLKAELIVGLRPGQPEALWAEDPDWLTNAKRGIIQMWLSDAAPRM